MAPRSQSHMLVVYHPCFGSLLIILLQALFSQPLSQQIML